MTRDLKDLYTENAINTQIFKIDQAQTSKDKDGKIAANRKIIADMKNCIAEEKAKPVSQQDKKYIARCERIIEDCLQSIFLARQAKVVFAKSEKKIRDEIQRQREIAEMLKYTGKNAMAK